MCVVEKNTTGMAERSVFPRELENIQRIPDIKSDSDMTLYERPKYEYKQFKGTFRDDQRLTLNSFRGNKNIWSKSG